MTCPSCGNENKISAKFCAQCGTTLARRCPNCGAPSAAGAAFCDECGQRLDGAAPSPPSAAATAGGTTERRLVSVLFADLVGFTTASESRDAEDVRELLNRYFETCSGLVARYGGTVEKFIGDAVMAVWGTPVANEDDPERAVRAALDLTDAVAELGAQAGIAGLQARAAVLTGEAAVAVGAVGQGMVAGDLVNTASRVQSLAPPGAVYVDAATRRMSEAAIVCQPVGEHQIRGKELPLHLWRAARVTGGIKGKLRADGLEGPFVGRDRELRLLKQLFHAAADERKAHLVSVTGIGGIGKSRLAWEFFKYIDGVADLSFWHRGRCLAYGEGVTYWALAEMVRMRCGIGEDENADTSLAKLREALDLRVADGEERRWIEPRLAHLLGLGERTDWERGDLFGAWRRFFECLAEAAPTVLVFEDMQWADSALMDFVEHLLDWSRSFPLFVVTLARPELDERHPGWAAGRRNFTSLYLEPLAPAAMEELLAGLVPGLPDELMRQLLERSEGIPLYAVETIRMLLDRGLLTRDQGEYRVTGPVGALEVPESLHALIAARLDGLQPEERRLVQHAAVLGKTFNADGIAALAADTGDSSAALGSLVRKEIFGIHSDPRSPERGQYGFLQDLVRKVAYDTLSRRERKTLHLRAGEFLETRGGAEAQDLAQVVAAHYVDAYESQPDAEDAAEVKARALEALVRAGERAKALVASAEAQRYFEQAAELAPDDASRADLLSRAGHMAWNQNKAADATARFEAAKRIYESLGDTHAAAKVAADLGFVVWRGGDINAALAQMQQAMEVLRSDKPAAETALLASSLARVHLFRDDSRRAAEYVDLALKYAELLRLPAILSEALNTKGMILVWMDGRHEEGIGLLKHSLDIAIENELADATMRAHTNLTALLETIDRTEDCEAHCRAAIALAQKSGSRAWECMGKSNLVEILYQQGRWDEAIETWAQVPSDALAILGGVVGVVRIHLARGDVDAARRAYGPIEARYRGSADTQEKGICDLVDSLLLRADGRCEEALTAAQALRANSTPGRLVSQWAVDGLVESAEALFCLGRIDEVKELVASTDELYPGMVSKFARAHIARLRGRLAVEQGRDPGADYAEAAALFDSISNVYWRAIAQVELAEWLAGAGRAVESAEPARAAAAVFNELRAQTGLERAGAVLEAGAPA